MDRQTFLFIGVALVVAAVLTYVLYSFVAPQPVTKKRVVTRYLPPNTVQILVAKDNIQPGTKINSTLLSWQKWPQDNITPEYIIRGTAKLETFIGRVARWPITQGQPITNKLIVHPGTAGFLATIIKPNKRAVTIGVNPSTAVGGFISPGDRVDIILTHSSKEGSKSETILHNILVLAYDQLAVKNPNKQAQIVKTITLEVTPRQAEKIAVAKSIGSLSFSLRSLSSDTSNSLFNHYTTSVQDVHIQKPKPQKATKGVAIKQNKHTITIIKGLDSSKISVSAEGT